MKSIWLLVGEANTRKSSMVRCLLGIGKTGTHVEVQTVAGAISSIWGMIGAAQEQPLSPAELLIKLNKTVDAIPNVLLPLRYDPEKSQPAADVYVQALRNDGWIIQAIVSLGEPARPWLQNLGIPYIEVPNSAIIPSNTIAAQLRVAFGWL